MTKKKIWFITGAVAEWASISPGPCWRRVTPSSPPAAMPSAWRRPSESRRTYWR